MAATFPNIDHCFRNTFQPTTCSSRPSDSSVVCFFRVCEWFLCEFFIAPPHRFSSGRGVRSARPRYSRHSDSSVQQIGDKHVRDGPPSASGVCGGDGVRMVKMSGCASTYRGGSVRDSFLSNELMIYISDNEISNRFQVVNLSINHKQNLHSPEPIT